MAGGGTSVLPLPTWLDPDTSASGHWFQVLGIDPAFWAGPEGSPELSRGLCPIPQHCPAGRCPVGHGLHLRVGLPGQLERAPGSRMGRGSVSDPAGRRAGGVGDAAFPGSPLLSRWVPDGGLLPPAGHSEVLSSRSVCPSGASCGPGCLGHGTPPRAILRVSNAAFACRLPGPAQLPAHRHWGDRCPGGLRDPAPRRPLNTRAACSLVADVCPSRTALPLCSGLFGCWSEDAACWWPGAGGPGPCWAVPALSSHAHLSPMCPQGRCPE